MDVRAVLYLLLFSDINCFTKCDLIFTFLNFDTHQ